MGTDPNIPKPGKYLIELRDNGLKLKVGFRSPGFFEASSIKSTKIDYSVGNSGLSAGGALVGGMLAGDVGAIAGAGRGSKKVESFITVIYKDKTGVEQKATFSTKLAEKIKKKIDKKYSLA